MYLSKLLLHMSESYPGGWAEGDGHLLDDGQVAWSRGCYLVVPGGQQTPVVSVVSWESHATPSAEHSETVRLHTTTMGQQLDLV